MSSSPAHSCCLRFAGCCYVQVTVWNSKRPALALRAILHEACPASPQSEEAVPTLDSILL